MKPPGEDAHPPPRIPDYELLHCIGHGSYGEVWLARNLTGAFRAVKVIHRRAIDGNAAFEREFRGLKQFEPVSRLHDSQVAIFHVGMLEQDEGFFYVMELADDANDKDPMTNDESPARPVGATSHSTFDIRHSGFYVPRTLKHDLQQRGRLPAAECLRIGLALTTALRHLHEHGLVHRDIKPSNIIFVRGQPKLADIGLVAASEGTVSFVGTLGYFAPEGPGTPRADLFSLGKVLYEASTGKDRQSFPEPLTHLGPADDADLLAELNEIILKACAPEPRWRYATAQEMHDELERLHAGQSIQRVRVLERRLQWFRKVALASLLILVLGGAALWRERQQAAKLRAVAEESRLRLVRLNVANGLHLLDSGDFLGAQLWFTDALKLARTPEEEKIHRHRIAAVRNQCPTLEHVGLHERAINHAEFSRDGARFLTTSDDGTAAVWDTAAGALIARLAGHEKPVNHASFSPDSRRVVTAGDDGTARLWDSATGRVLGNALRHEKAVVSAIFSADGRRILTASEDGTAGIWSVASGNLAAPFLSHGAALRFAMFSPDGALVVTGGDDPAVRLWNSGTGQPAAPALRHPASVLFAAFSPDGARLVTACRERNARVWDVATARELAVLGPHVGKLRFVTFSPDGKKILTTSGEHLQNGDARVWDAASGQPVTPSLPHGSHVPHGSFSADGRWVATACSDQFVRIWDANTGQQVGSALRHNHPVWVAQFSPVGHRLATGGSEGVWRLWEYGKASTAPLIRGGCALRREKFTAAAWAALFSWVKDGGRLMSEQPREGVIRDFSPDGQRVLAAFRNNSARVVNVATGSPTSGRTELATPVEFAAFDPTGQWLVTAGRDGSARVWNAHSGEPVTPPLLHDSPVRHAAFSPDGRLLATAAGKESIGGPGEARLWNIPGGQPAGFVLQRPGCVSQVAFNPDGRQMAVAWGPGSAMPTSIEIRDVPEGRPVGPGLLHPDGVNCATFSPDGRWLATGCTDGMARLWSVERGNLLRSFRHRRGIQSVAFSPDGKRLATADTDGIGRIWDVATGEPVSPWLRGNCQIYHVVFSPDSNWLLTVDESRTARLWPVGAETRTVAELDQLSHFEASARIDDAGQSVTLTPPELIGLASEVRPVAGRR